MKELFTLLGLLCATSAFGGTSIERERFSLVLPDGWVEARAAYAIVVLDEDGPGAWEKKFPRFIASSKDCSCILSFIPRSPQVTAESQSARMMASSRSISSVSKEFAISTMGGREGLGYGFIRRHPYPVISVVRVFSFESNGYVCTVLVTTSDAKEGRAAKRMAKCTPAIEDIVRSIEIKKQANQPVEPTGTSVTDRADARSAPAAPVAHH